jgi:hypothetical protein
MSIGISNSVLNQKNAPAIYEDIYANRPAAGFSGRIFIATDTSQIFVDNGTTWILIANTGIGSTGTLQVVTTNGNTTNTGITITAGGLATNSTQITGLTQSGGVLFTDGSGNIAQDVNFNWDISNNYLGIGQTGTPTAPLDIHNDTTNVFMQLNATSTNNSTLAFQNASVGKWRIGNLYSSGANLFHIYNNTAANNALTINSSNAATFTGTITGSSIIKSGGTSSEFLKANGSVDSTAYISLTSLSSTSPLQYNNTTGIFSILQSGASQSGYLSSTDWNTFNNKASLGAFSATTPLSYNSGTGAFSIQVANTGQSGYLSNTDWNTFNSKQAALSFGNLTETSSSVLTIAGGTGAVIGSGTTIAVKQSSAIQSGYLSSTDWTTFNNKQTQINGTGFVKASGTTISYDNSTYYLASNPSNYITLASLSGTTPISYNNGTGAISIAQSSTSSSGYLSSTDWNTFNNKASLTAFSASPPLSYNSGTGAFSITQSSGSTNGYLSSTDWTTFNSKQSALTNPITGTGTSGYVPKFNGTTTITNSIIQDGGTGITINGSTVITTSLQSQTALFLTTTTPAINAIRDLDVTSAGTAGQGIAFGARNGSTPTAGAAIYGTLDNPATTGSLFLQTLNGGTLSTRLTISNTGAATFSNNLVAINGNGLTEFKINNNTTEWEFYMPNGGTDLRLYRGTDKVVFTSAGNVGIGLSTPSDFGAGYSVLSINGTSGGGAIDLISNGTRSLTLAVDAGSPQIAAKISGQNLRFLTNSGSGSTERMVITGGGNVLIGTTTDAGYKLDVNGTFRASNVLSGTYTPTLTNNANITSSTAYQCQYMRVGNVVTVSGQVDITATSVLTLTQLIMTLPISSSFPVSGFNYCGGTAYFQNGAAFATGYINANQSATTVSLVYRTGATTPISQFFFSFTYQIV